jgi:hypothetical protein
VTQTPAGNQKPGATAFVEKFTKPAEAKQQGDAPSAFKKRAAVKKAVEIWDKNEKALALDLLLDEWVSSFPKGEVSKTRQRLEFLETRFGTPLERKDPKSGKVVETVRRKSTASVLQELVSFVLSAADSDAEGDYGVLDTPENEKVVSALTALAEGSTELVAVTRRDYNALQKLKRLLLEKGENFKLPDGGTIKEVVGDFFPEGLAAAFTDTQLKQWEERKAKAAEKAAKKAAKETENN